jgi:hypothetical protein
LGEPLDEALVEQIGPHRAAAMVHQPDDGPDAQRAESLQPAGRPGPVRRLEAGGGDGFPEHRHPQRPEAERGEAVEVGEPVAVAVAAQLVEPAVAHTIHRALHASPQLGQAPPFLRHA